MKKLWILLGLIVLALFVVSCAPKESAEGDEVEEEGALAGEAVKIGGKTVRVACEWFPAGAESKSLTGKEFCQSKGFDTCESVMQTIVSSFYSSTDKTCNGNLQTYFVNTQPAQCKFTISGMEETECNTFEDGSGFTNVVEPVSGDAKMESQVKGVNCCKAQ